MVIKDRNKEMSKDGNKDILWADIALSCEYNQNGGGDDQDYVRIHRGLRARLTSHIGRAKVLVELATRHARRSASSSLIWHDHRKLHDKSMVLLPLFGCCQRRVRFYRRACTLFSFKLALNRHEWISNMLREHNLGA